MQIMKLLRPINIGNFVTLQSSRPPHEWNISPFLYREILIMTLFPNDAPISTIEVSCNIYRLLYKSEIQMRRHYFNEWGCIWHLLFITPSWKSKFNFRQTENKYNIYFHPSCTFLYRISNKAKSIMYYILLKSYNWWDHISLIEHP